MKLPAHFRVVYLGTGDIGLPALAALAEFPGADLAGVVTQPDRPAGRGHELRPGPVKTFALERGIPILQPEKLRSPGAVEALAALNADLFVVMAYGQILSNAVLALPKVTTLNLHASLLPRHRGASPVQAALLAGDRESGITVMYVDEGLDTGDVLLSKSVPTAPDETGGSLHDKLAAIAPEALSEALLLLVEGHAPKTPQIPGMATYAPKIRKEDGVLDWNEPAGQIERKVRAYSPWPGAFAVFSHPVLPKHPLKVWKAAVCDPAKKLSPGEVCGMEEGRLIVRAASGGVELLEVQAPGRRRMRVAEFLRGLHLG